MILRKIAIALVVLSTMVGFIACNSTSYESEDVTLPGSTAVKSFTLSPDDSAKIQLDSVFFSIDLVKGLIFNADSLPVGTEVTELNPVVTTAQGASAIKFTVTRTNGTDTVYNYSVNTKDAEKNKEIKIDFTNPVKMLVTSTDGKNSREYTIKINVHKMIADTLEWNNGARTMLPTSLSAPEEQRTVRMADSFYCLTRQGSDYCMGSRTGSLSGLNGAVLSLADWNVAAVTFPFTPRVSSLSASAQVLYILDTEGKLWKSTDSAQSWSDTGLKWNHIYGAHQDKLLGNFLDSSGAWKLQEYPSQAVSDLPDGMPVSGTSLPVAYSFQWSDREQSFVVGGRKSDGTLTAATWGYDGYSWARISKTNLPQPLEDVALASYVTYVKAYGLNDFPTLMVFGGRKSDGQLNSEVYISSDYGFIWSKAADKLQLPSHMGKFTAAQAHVMSSAFKVNITPAPARIIKPIEEWECPYIYIFGGINEQNQLNNSVWRGVINRYTFRPIE